MWLLRVTVVAITVTLGIAVVSAGNAEIYNGVTVPTTGTWKCTTWSPPIRCTVTDTDGGAGGVPRSWDVAVGGEVVVDVDNTGLVSCSWSVNKTAEPCELDYHSDKTTRDPWVLLVSFPVGGVAGLLDGGPESFVSVSDGASGNDNVLSVVAAVAGVVVFMTVGGWYVRRRWMSRM